MLKIVLSVSLLFSINLNEDFRVDRITYNFDESTDSMFFLRIDLYSQFKDIIELKIYFCDINKKLKNNKYYSSVLEVEKSKSTIAKIPYTIKENMYLRINFYNNSAKNEVFDLFFPVYPKEKNVCDLNKSRYCESNNSALVVYENKEIKEMKSKVFLVNETLNFYSFNNKLNVERIKLNSNLFNEEGYAYIYIREKIDSFNVYYNEGYTFTLNLKNDSNLVSLSLGNKYYLNIIDGEISDYYVNDSIYTNDILFPYTDKTYNINLKVIDSFVSFHEVIINFSITVKGALIGDCLTSKYCLRRDYI